ncbi:DMT family transporter [Gynuella sunshinyii]|uniref:Permeases of the drug/metabolite transporter (DMT) superfamily n=1 Tax=Gynuella sunshinyii YC6258 TaxID=1445510 RepID=A0A0C5V2D0_9GAMM|nr:DMT family transporter [Gynuella sunshinyii]AJQ93660.1 permeases of the drug/metabolite transporter (DMT) superfamily [Gynuella sunshinyii YC6258]
MRLPPFVFAMLANLFWAGNAIAGKMAAGQIPPLTLNFWRWCLAALILAPIAAPQSWRHRVWFWQHKWLVLALSILSVTLYNTIQYLALKYTSPGNVGIVTAMIPVIILIMNILLFGHRPSRYQVSGIALALAGVVYVLTGGDFTELKINRGDAVMLLSVLSFATYSVLLQKVPREMETGAVLFVLMLVGIVCMFPAYAFEVNQGGHWDMGQASNWYLLLYVATLPSIGSYYCWNIAIKHGGSMLTGLSINLLPVFALVLAWMLLGDAVEWVQLVAVALIFSGIYVATRRKDV